MKLNKNTVLQCSILDLPKIKNSSGNISIFENALSESFDVKRIYYLYDIPSGEARGGHAHYELEQYLIAVSGSFDVILDDGKNKKLFKLNNPNQALHIVPGLWRSINNFSGSSILLVLASHKYNESDYIRDYDLYLKLKNEE